MHSTTLEGSTMPNHENYQHQMIDTLRTRLLTMGAQSQEALHNATIALLTGNADKAQAVRTGDDLIDTMENEIDTMALGILARSQPVAKDLRFVVTALRMVLDLERIGDESVLVAKQALRMRELEPYELSPAIAHISARSNDLLHTALESFQQGNVEQALQITGMNTEISDLFVTCTEQIVHGLSVQQASPWGAMSALMAVRALDRVCRRAQNIAEHTYFMVEGISLKHRTLK